MTANAFHVNDWPDSAHEPICPLVLTAPQLSPIVFGPYHCSTCLCEKQELGHQWPGMSRRWSTPTAQPLTKAGVELQRPYHTANPCVVNGEQNAQFAVTKRTTSWWWNWHFLSFTCRKIIQQKKNLPSKFYRADSPALWQFQKAAAVNLRHHYLHSKQENKCERIH